MLYTLLKTVTKDSYTYSSENIISCAKHELHWLHLQLQQV